MSKDNNEFPSFLESNQDKVSLGKALQNARLKAELSVDDVAAKLNLGVAIILDIENNLENVLETQKYPVIYLRGYLSNYAKLISLKNLESHAEYQSLSRAQQHKQTFKSSNLIMSRTKKRSKKWSVLLFVFVIIGASIYYYQAELLKTIGLSSNSFEPLTGITSEGEFKEDLAEKLLSQIGQSENTDNDLLNKQDNLENDDTNLSEQVMPARQKSDVIQEGQLSQSNIQETDVVQTINTSVNNELDEIAATQEDFNVRTDVETPVTESENDTINIDIVSEVESETTVDAGPENISLQFNGECWTEVYDATGERIAFGLYDTGRVLTLTGMAPFKLKLGDPSAVEIQYQDKIIEGEFTPGRSAQFTVPLS